MERKIYKISWRETESGRFLDAHHDMDTMIISSRSIIGIIKDEEEIRIQKLAGRNLPAVYLKALLRALPKEWLEEAESLHQSRKYSWSIGYHEGTSGCRDYCLYSYIYTDFPEFRIKGNVVHVSMFEKLDEEWYGWLGDIPPLLNMILEDYEQMKPEMIKEIRTIEYDKHNPGESSGLLEKIFNIEPEENEYEKAERQYAEYAEEVVDENNYEYEKF